MLQIWGFVSDYPLNVSYGRTGPILHPVLIIKFLQLSPQVLCIPQTIIIIAFNRLLVSKSLSEVFLKKVFLGLWILKQEEIVHGYSGTKMQHCFVEIQFIAVTQQYIYLIPNERFNITSQTKETKINEYLERNLRPYLTEVKPLCQTGPFISVILEDQSAFMYFVTSSCFMADIHSKIQGRDTVATARGNKGSNIKELHYCSQFMQSGS